MASSGIEPESKASETSILSVVLRGQSFYKYQQQLSISKMVIGCWRLEVGCWKSEVELQTKNYKPKTTNYRLINQ